MFYNGWTHDHYFGNLFVLAPNGTIIACALNALGSMHESVIAAWGKDYEKLEQVIRTDSGTCVGDSTFSKGPV